MNHLIAILALALGCMLWFFVQRLAGRDGEAKCDTCETPGCAQRRSASGPDDATAADRRPAPSAH